ncbi:MAG: thymidylate synthase [archaeon]
MSLVDEIKNQVGSNGERGWPVAVRDRIHFPHPKESVVSDASAGVTFLWTERMGVVPNLDKSNLAIATSFYTPSGLEGMVRNVLGNPFIRHVIMLGDEYSSRTDFAAGGRSTNEMTSANAIRAFFKRGITSNRKLEGFGNSIYFDKNIPTEEIDKVRRNVDLVDLNLVMLGASLDVKIKRANKLMDRFERGNPFGRPQTFGYEEMSDSFPYEGGSLIVHGRNIPEAWVRMISVINRFGVFNLMNAGTDRKVKEINNMTVVVEDSQDEGLGVNPFLVPMTLEKIRVYQAEMLSSVLPEGKAYTYGNKLRAYLLHKKSLAGLVDDAEAAGESARLGWEFPGEVHDRNINYLDDGFCKVNQVADMIDVLKRDSYSKACVAMTWHPGDELMRKHKSSPCLVYMQALVQNEKLNLTNFFRSHDMVQGWPENAYGCVAVQKEIADGIGVEPGLLTMISGSAQIYGNYYNQVGNMLEKYGHLVGNCSDKRGNFRIGLGDGEICATLTHPNTGRELEIYRGRTASELRDKICARMDLQTPHAVYLGQEFARAEVALKEGKNYEQG